jgi:hypothetical protein
VTFDQSCLTNVEEVISDDRLLVQEAISQSEKLRTLKVRYAVSIGELYEQFGYRLSRLEHLELTIVERLDLVDFLNTVMVHRLKDVRVCQLNGFAGLLCNCLLERQDNECRWHSNL